MIFTIKKYSQKSNNFLFKIFDFLHSKDRLSYKVNFTNAPKYVNKKQVFARKINRLFSLIIGYRKSVGFSWEYFHKEIYI